MNGQPTGKFQTCRRVKLIYKTAINPLLTYSENFLVLIGLITGIAVLPR